jgi:hypothetical protein
MYGTENSSMSEEYHALKLDWLVKLYEQFQKQDQILDQVSQIAKQNLEILGRTNSLRDAQSTLEARRRFSDFIDSQQPDEAERNLAAFLATQTAKEDTDNLIRILGISEIEEAGTSLMSIWSGYVELHKRKVPKDKSEEETVADLEPPLFSFEESINWVSSFLDQSLSQTESRLKELVKLLNQGFPIADEHSLKERLLAATIVKLDIDNAILLYAVGRTGAAIVDLYGVLESRAKEKLAALVFRTEMYEFGLEILKRDTLRGFSTLLQRFGLLRKDDVKFAERITNVRNGLAHKNASIVSKALFSGKTVEISEIDSLMLDIDISPYVIGTIKYLIRLEYSSLLGE